MKSSQLVYLFLTIFLCSKSLHSQQSYLQQQSVNAQQFEQFVVAIVITPGFDSTFTSPIKFINGDYLPAGYNANCDKYSPYTVEFQLCAKFVSGCGSINGKELSTGQSMCLGMVSGLQIHAEQNSTIAFNTTAEPFAQFNCNGQSFESPNNFNTC